MDVVTGAVAAGALAVKVNPLVVVVDVSGFLSSLGILKAGVSKLNSVVLVVDEAVGVKLKVVLLAGFSVESATGLAVSVLVSVVFGSKEKIGEVVVVDATAGVVVVIVVGVIVSFFLSSLNNSNEIPAGFGSSFLSSFGVSNVNAMVGFCSTFLSSFVSVTNEKAIDFDSSFLSSFGACSVNFDGSSFFVETNEKPLLNSVGVSLGVSTVNIGIVSILVSVLLVPDVLLSKGVVELGIPKVNSEDDGTPFTTSVGLVMVSCSLESILIGRTILFLLTFCFSESFFGDSTFVCFSGIDSCCVSILSICCRGNCSVAFCLFVESLAGLCAVVSSVGMGLGLFSVDFFFSTVLSLTTAFFFFVLFDSSTCLFLRTGASCSAIFGEFSIFLFVPFFDTFLVLFTTGANT